MKKKVWLLSSLFTAALLTGCDLSGDKSPEFRAIEMTPRLEAAKNKALALCSGCHGPYGVGTADFNPNLACQKKMYMVKQLNDYRNGQRNNHIPMVNIAKMLTEEEVDAISTWYSLQRCSIDTL
ncbi:c-type cytochrome [Endozoicomonas numazuensis]|uniref:c-type cytochrome n=1 Tax=Endozoicomonas numazuensis TaxID=1137799 RepID=UPI00069075DF|nr:c-type cytochrome [Endozoicomonas numazuensis]